MDIKIFTPVEAIPSDIILPHQTHGINIVEIVTGDEDLSDCDGIWTRDPRFKLGIRTADCAPVCFWNEEKFGIVHAGWRGLVGGICEKMLGVFGCVFDGRGVLQYASTGLNVFVGPILSRFEIQKDFCYEMIRERFGERHFNVETPNLSVSTETIWFDFEGAIRKVLPMAQWDGRSTYDTAELASWRRDRDEGRNITVISDWNL